MQHVPCRGQLHAHKVVMLQIRAMLFQENSTCKKNNNTSTTNAPVDCLPLVARNRKLHRSTPKDPVSAVQTTTPGCQALQSCIEVNCWQCRPIMQDSHWFSASTLLT